MFYESMYFTYAPRYDMCLSITCFWVQVVGYGFSNRKPSSLRLVIRYHFDLCIHLISCHIIRELLLKGVWLSLNTCDAIYFVVSEGASMVFYWHIVIDRYITHLHHSIHVHLL